MRNSQNLIPMGFAQKLLYSKHLVPADTFFKNRRYLLQRGLTVLTQSNLKIRFQIAKQRAQISLFAFTKRGLLQKNSRKLSPYSMKIFHKSCISKHLARTVSKISNINKNKNKYIITSNPLTVKQRNLKGVPHISKIKSLSQFAVIAMGFSVEHFHSYLKTSEMFD